LALKVRDDEFALELELRVEKGIVLQGDRGLSYKGSREASYYYSIPRLGAQGLVKNMNAPDGVEVTGTCWLDREWSTSVLADNLVGWDWFALQFDTGDDLMLFQLRESEGVKERARVAESELPQPPRRQGKIISPSGTAITLTPSQLQFEPLRYWRDETGVDWPIEWRVQTPDRELRVVAALNDQKMRSSIAYWEGLVWVYEADRRIGQGYLEMTGYSPH